MGYYYKRIRELREDNDLTQEQIAKKLDVKLTVYRRWEIGERTILTNKLIELSKIYNVSTDYILGISNIKEIATNTKISKNQTITIKNSNNNKINM